MSDLKSKIESILFISGDALSIKQIKRALGEEVDNDKIKKALEDLGKEYQNRGIRIFSKEDKIQMVTAPENATIIEKLVKSQLTEELTPAALETLACIAYKEPISKIEIDELRGLNSIFSLRSLMIRGLIEKIACRPETGEKADCFKTTLDFLKKLGIEKVTDLPKYEQTAENN